MRKQKLLKRIPDFASEREERKFWETHDTADYVDWSRARVAVFPDLKASTEAISLRLPASLLAEIKNLANKRDVPYQSLLKVFLAERVVSERAREKRGMPGIARPRTARSSRRSRKPHEARQLPRR
jgi:predicted DNA binding CopG/RHH family protein